MSDRPHPAMPTRERPQTPPRPPLIDSQTLLCGGNEVLIQHRGDLYRLRLTQAGKLILTK